MSLRPLFLLALPIAMVGCTADADLDGLSNKAEIEAGTDPDNADTDGDGLSDAEEIDLGTDPLDRDSDDDLLHDGVEQLGFIAEIDGDDVQIVTDPLNRDTDGDGYKDYDEVFTGHDPMDEDDRIYEAGWPYQRYKDDIADRKASKGMAIGMPFARDSYKDSDNKTVATFKDPHGDNVDLFDFAYHGKPILIDVSAQWCAPCKNYALWLSGTNEDLNAQYDGLFPGVRDAVNNGDVYWITFLGENNAGDGATKQTVKEWEDEFPQPNIPVLADTHKVVVDFIDLGFWPSFILLDEDMSVVTDADGGSLQALSARFE